MAYVDIENSKAIQDLKAEYQAAVKAGASRETLDAIHGAAEKLRNEAGYMTDKWGLNPIDISELKSGVSETTVKTLLTENNQKIDQKLDDTVNKLVSALDLFTSSTTEKKASGSSGASVSASGSEAAGSSSAGTFTYYNPADYQDTGSINWGSIFGWVIAGLLGVAVLDALANRSKRG